MPDSLRIFVAPPSDEDLEARLVGRGTETPEELERRNADAEMEMKRRADYDYVVVNETDEAAATADAIDRIIRHEHNLFPDRRVSL